MDIISQSADSLTLSAVKEHLYVDFVDDDALIQSYMNASMNYVRLAIHKEILLTTYESTVAEEVLIDESYYKLYIDFKPSKVSVTQLGDIVTELVADDYTFDPAGYLLVSEVTDLDKITAENGDLTQDPIIDQIRLMLIANWYSFREADFTSTINEVPNGVSRLMDIIQNSPI